MIYSNPIIEYYDLRPMLRSNKTKFKYNNEMLDVFPIYIPRDYARGETDEKPDTNEVPNIPHYTLYIMNQPSIKKDNIIIYELPSGLKVSIILYRFGGVDFDKDSRKNVLRETDELDRRIILGFCKYYNSNIGFAADDINNNKIFRKSITDYAASYRHTMMPKRIKRGPERDQDKYDAIFAKFESFNLFESVVMI